MRYVLIHRFEPSFELQRFSSVFNLFEIKIIPREWFSFFVE